MDKEQIKKSIKKTFKKVGNVASKAIDATYKEFSYYTSVESFKIAVDCRNCFGKFFLLLVRSILKLCSYALYLETLYLRIFIFLM